MIDALGNPLPTEFFTRSADGKQQYQPHYEEISDPTQVLIYETLVHDQSGKFTTSFIHGCTIIKDNRVLPRGWSEAGPGAGLKGHFLTVTYPGPIARQDLRYQDGSGSDQISYRMTIPRPVPRDNLRVQVTLYYQALPPYFLKNIFDITPNSPAAKRLDAICRNLTHKGTAIEDWKLKVVSASSKPRQNRTE